MRRPLLVFVLGLLLGAVAGGLLVRGSPVSRVGVARPLPPDPAASPDTKGPTSETVAALRAELEIERAMRARLQEQLGGLEATHGREPPRPAAIDDHPVPPTPPAADAADADRQPWFAGDALAAVGMQPADVERIKERWEQYAMERLYLADAFKRGGGRSHADLRRDQLQLEAAVRQELGDDGYDAMLYASGEKNRIVIGDVLSESPAAEIGLESGDELLSYDGQRVFRPVAVLAATAQGRAGELVELRVRRGDEMLRLFAPRGPLGVRMQVETRPPYLP